MAAESSAAPVHDRSPATCPAIAVLRRALEKAPNSSRLGLLLAWELSTAPDPALRDDRPLLRSAPSLTEINAPRATKADWVLTFQKPART